MSGTRCSKLIAAIAVFQWKRLRCSIHQVSDRPTRRVPSGPSCRRLAWLGKAVLGPGIGCVRVAPDFPEPKDIPIQEGDFPDELRAFPRVTLWNDDPCRP